MLIIMSIINYNLGQFCLFIKRFFYTVGTSPTVFPRKNVNNYVSWNSEKKQLIYFATWVLGAELVKQFINYYPSGTIPRMDMLVN